MAMNLDPSALHVQEQEAQEQEVQEQEVQETWKTWKKSLEAYCQIAYQKDKYAWTEEEAKEMDGKPRCRFYLYTNGIKNEKPIFKVYFRNLKEKEAIQAKINAVISEHNIKQRGRSLYVCSNEFENFSIFINPNRLKRDYVFKTFIIESITGYTYAEYKDYINEGVHMDEVANNFEF